MSNSEGQSLSLYAVPVPTDTGFGNSRIFRYRLASDFASHLIAAREHVPAQAARRRAVPEVATSAYASRKLRRVPAGYRLSASA